MHPASPIPHPVVIDTDPGIDDMLALFLALASPELDVRGISISYGNTVVENAYRNTVEILRRAGARGGDPRLREVARAAARRAAGPGHPRHPRTAHESRTGPAQRSGAG